MTLEAAYSLRLEDEVGSIVPGKLANFTILDDNPLTVAADKIQDIGIWGTVHEGRVLPKPTFAGAAPDHASLGPVPNGRAYGFSALQWVTQGQVG
ncbi:amidohydrolase family protein [Tropicimonas sp. TH_r6]|uniref:amidohydrolase family protein n=1 Tax=Tropicimonas sp. TH_r6 TaxID=3082085 RepID=UPI0029538B43|nr:amidohydrolase family protein [Tropicimonas sp. TH_r6]MDV7144312.1 amidohydrolase family protein [Tropicimonas sp. TH_r6]